MRHDLDDSTDKISGSDGRSIQAMKLARHLGVGAPWDDLLISTERT